MANDVAITAGAGTAVATDEVASRHYQLVKLVDGTEDSAARIGGDATNGLDVDVTRVSGTVAVTGPVTDAQLRASAVPVTANAGTNLNTSALALETTATAIKTAVETIDNAIAGNEMQVDVLTLPNVTLGAAIPAGTNNIGDVDVLTLPALPAGTNNIGDVDVLSLPALPAGSNAIGTVDTELPAAALAADAAALPTAPFVRTVLYGHNGTTLDMLRIPTIFAPLSAVDVASEATIYDPTASKKFRLLGFDLAGDVAGEYILRDNTAGTVIYRTYLAANSPKVVSLGNGILSAAVNNLLTGDGPAASHLTGTLYLTEEV